jgi:hypothetical protein
MYDVLMKKDVLMCWSENMLPWGFIPRERHQMTSIPQPLSPPRERGEDIAKICSMPSPN